MATAKKKRPTRGATRSPEKKGMPASVMLGTGFIAGVLSTVLVFNMMNERAPSAPEKNTRAEKVEPAPPAEKTTTTKFDFFTVLPEREVIVPDETPQPARKPKVVANEAPPPEDDSKRFQTGERYILQAGSFRNNEDADRRRAQILLLGLDAKVELVEANGDRWHRVYVGPFLTHNTLSSARSKLINESIDTLVIRQKTP
ncbi:SPOR domain-containing protein [Spongiibacter sp.]|uniref:SPOR domain-containing protein n=1 Tax=Spongiibacter sp. TaxID=2024860 RepID=UPI000C67F40E|nr:SPOR domain-containing protein [Spongiibacter sp.]MBU70934.1 SPOR domain-containing protein [Spongiibacter sp.]